MISQSNNGVSSVRRQLEQGFTLPSDWYTSEAILSEEKRKIFKKAWHYVGVVGQISSPGDYFTTTVADVPVIVVRGETGEIHAHVNICPHRLTEVVAGHGSTRFLQCPYHAWTFGLDGCLKHAPDCAEEKDFDKAKLGLKPLAVELWGIFIFANLDNEAVPFDTQLNETKQILARFGIDVHTLTVGKETPFDVAANWKILAENYLECYHCAIAHKNFSKIIDISAEKYTLEAIGGELISTGPLRPVPGRNPKEPHGYDPAGEIPESVWILVWPNLTINILPGLKNLSFYHFSPVTPERTAAAFQYFYAPGVDETFKSGLEGFWDEVGREDMALVESVQRAISSGAIAEGRLVLKRESLIQAFQLLTHDALALRS